MADLELNGPLDLMGTIDLVADGGGTVLVNGAAALVEGATGSDGVPVILPTPPASPIDTGTTVECVKSLGAGITASGKTVVTTGMIVQGASKSWPGMITPSTGNTGPHVVTANAVPINVEGDKAVVFPNGGSASFTSNGQH